MSDHAAPPFRLLPQLDELNSPFWQGGERGELVFLACRRCGTLVHPPAPVCPVDHGRDLEPRPVSGQATVASYTVNHQPWMPGLDVPYVIAVVEVVEQPAVRLMTNIIDCDPEDVHIGMPVEVRFEHHPDPEGDVWLPLFAPASERA